MQRHLITQLKAQNNPFIRSLFSKMFQKLNLVLYSALRIIVHQHLEEYINIRRWQINIKHAIKDYKENESSNKNFLFNTISNTHQQQMM